MAIARRLTFGRSTAATEVCVRLGRGMAALLCGVILVASCGSPGKPAASAPPDTTASPAPATTQPTPTSPSTAPPSLPATALCGNVVTAATGSAAASQAGAKYEPPDGNAYFGFAFRLWEGDATWGDTRTFAERICDAVKVELSGKTPTILWLWTGWLDAPGGLTVPFSAVKRDIDMIHAALGPTVVPFLPWTITLQEGGSTAPVTTKDVASGAYDGYIRQYADDVRANGRPLLIAPLCFEMNGNWWPACSPKANPTLTRADFVHAWRRVVDLFREEGVTNVAWVWDPVTPLPADQDWGWDSDWKAYYPGDAYVDWVGSSLFEWGQPNWIGPLYTFAVAHAKPFILTQFGVRGAYTKMTHKQHVRWLTAMLDYVEAHPHIKAILYWNYKGNPDPDPTGPGRVTLYSGQVSYVPDVNDDDVRLLASGADVRKLFAGRIADSRYISALAGS